VEFDFSSTVFEFSNFPSISISECVDPVANVDAEILEVGNDVSTKGIKDEDVYLVRERFPRHC
jgi:hypothetical protein